MIRMSQRLKTLFNEIEIYRRHCLFQESLKRCGEASRLIGTLGRTPVRKDLSGFLSTKIQKIKTESRAFDKAARPMRMKSDEQAQVMELFSGPGRTGGSWAREKVYRGAEALFIFGQYESAIAEFDKLLDSGPYRLRGAKGILLSLAVSSGFENAVSQYRHWLKDRRFTPEDLKPIRLFLEKIVDLKGATAVLPPLTVERVGADRGALDHLGVAILSVSLPVENAAAENGGLRFDVTGQKGNLISFDVPPRHPLLKTELVPGKRLHGILLTTRSVFFKDTGVITERRPLPKTPDTGAVRITVRISGI